MQRTSTASPPSVQAAHVTPSQENSLEKGRTGGPLRFAIIGLAALLLLLAGLVAWYELGHSGRIRARERSQRHEPR